ncbi:ParB/Srx family N-terminal domain-containing protein [Roseibium aggregatum]|uniref:ParB/Srx family N-terminal domain-containing protein n=1 Tax=Roseibium aggregatum TaxID=187304 RepID=UPI0012F4CAF2|nr:ParB/Srx family N-terminal domain-containing protein [Roseibium aggregatum]
MRHIKILKEDGSIELQALSDEINKAASQLKYSPSQYFKNLASSVAIKTSALIQSRARAKGIENAVLLMAAAYAGTQSKRSPISVRPFDEGNFLVVDGNSTTSIAIAAGWPDIPCIILEST